MVWSPVVWRCESKPTIQTTNSGVPDDYDLRGSWPFGSQGKLGRRPSDRFHLFFDKAGVGSGSSKKGVGAWVWGGGQGAEGFGSYESKRSEWTILISVTVGRGEAVRLQIHQTRESGLKTQSPAISSGACAQKRPYLTMTNSWALTSLEGCPPKNAHSNRGHWISLQKLQFTGNCPSNCRFWWFQKGTRR